MGGSAEQFHDEDDETNSIVLNDDLLELGRICNPDDMACFLRGLVAHEIAHVLGFAHTNQPNAGGIFESDRIPGTPRRDSESLFNGNSLCESICQFSEHDIIGIQEVLDRTSCPDEFPRCDSPSSPGCTPGFTCVEGRCQPTLNCNNSLCPQDYKCVNGRCIPL